MKIISVLPKGRRILWEGIIPLLPKSTRRLWGDVQGLKMYLDLDQELDFQYFLGLYDNEELEFLIDAYKEGSFFIDIGSCQGFYSLYFAKKIPDAKILAFEPDPYHVNKLQKNIAENRFNNIIVCPYGISDCEEYKDLMINTSSNRGGNSMVLSQTPWTKKTDIKIRVPCKTLIGALNDNNVNRISALKIDIEGYEYQVLKQFFQDAPQTLYPKAVVVEAFGYIINKVGGSPIELLIKNGYTLVNHTYYNYFFELRDTAE